MVLSLVCGIPYGKRAVGVVPFCGVMLNSTALYISIIILINFCSVAVLVQTSVLVPILSFYSHSYSLLLFSPPYSIMTSITHKKYYYFCPSCPTVSISCLFPVPYRIFPPLFTCLVFFLPLLLVLLLLLRILPFSSILSFFFLLYYWPSYVSFFPSILTNYYYPLLFPPRYLIIVTPSNPIVRSSV